MQSKAEYSEDEVHKAQLRKSYTIQPYKTNKDKRERKHKQKIDSPTPAFKGISPIKMALEEESRYGVGVKSLKDYCEE